MNDIEVTTWGHSAVRFERGQDRLVIDPGNLSDPAVMESAGAVLITHEHADHFAAESLSEALAEDAQLHVWGPSPVVAELTNAGGPSDRVHEAVEGAEFSAAGFTVRVMGREHAVVHPSVPRVANLAYLIEGCALHPGDSFTTGPEDLPVQALFLPVSAPWLKLAESVEYLERVRPVTAVPIHDAVLSDPGKAITDRVMSGLAGDAHYRRLATGESLSIAP